MKKSNKWILIGLGGFLLLIFLIGITPDGEKTEIESSKEDKISQEQQVDSQKEEKVDEEKEEDGEKASAEEEPKEEETEEVEETRFAVLSGEDPETGEVLVLNINVWEEAGDGGQDNVAIGNIPHNTKVEVLESKEVEGYLFYKIRSSVGKVSVLPTEWEARVKAMEERPQEEWHVSADPGFPVEGWVLEDFIIN